jgi:hypothetical protein
MVEITIKILFFPYTLLLANDMRCSREVKGRNPTNCGTGTQLVSSFVKRWERQRLPH